MDVVVTVPKSRWDDWLAEGDLPGERWSGQTSYFRIGLRSPRIDPDERVYVVAHGKLRGYAPLVVLCVDPFVSREAAVWALARCGGAVAVTIPEPIKGFRGWRYRWWDRESEVPFPEWRIP